MAGIPQVITEDRASGAQVVEGSLRFDGSKSQYLKRTFSSGNGKTWTWSAWVKKHSVGTDRRLFASDADSSNQGAFKFIGDQIQFFFRTSGNFDINLYTEAFFRDTGWYHMMAVVDTTIASPSTDRVKLYVNGVLQTISSSYNTYPSENYQTRINSNVEHSIGRYISNGSQNINDSLSQVYSWTDKHLDLKILDILTHSQILGDLRSLSQLDQIMEQLGVVMSLHQILHLDQLQMFLMATFMVVRQP